MSTSPLKVQTPLSPGVNVIFSGKSFFKTPCARPRVLLREK
jgi:hypothetical protein